MRPAAGFLDFFHHVLDAARPVAALAIPEADEVDLVRTEARSGFQHPQIVAFIGAPIRRRRSAFGRRHVQHGARFRVEKAGAPVGVGEIDRFFQERRLVEGNVEFEPGGTREGGLREQKVAAARAAADGMDRSRGPRSRSARAEAMARAATGCLSGGKRGVSRPGASIMWPLNSSALRGERPFDGLTGQARAA
jgi:hypothetical protein